MFDPMQQTMESATPPNHTLPATPPNHTSPATPSNHTSPATPYTLHVPLTSNLATPTSQRIKTTICCKYQSNKLLSNDHYYYLLINS